MYEGGFGVRELGKSEPVNENTLFMAASNTKGMTTLLLSELVDENKLKWDEPVIEAYPQFELGNLDITKKVLIENLICACTGMPRQDYEWLPQLKYSTPESVFKMLATMQPTSKFGEVFQYQSHGFRRRVHWGSHCFSRHGPWVRIRPGHAEESLRSSWHEVDNIRLREGPGSQSCESARR